MLEVIAGIDNDGKVFSRDDLGKPMGEFRAADAACQGNDFHFVLLPLTQRAL
jgi:hypothetical protein